MIWSMIGAPIEPAAGGRVVVRAALGAGQVALEVDPGPTLLTGPATLTAHEARRVRVLLDAAIAVAQQEAVA